MSELSVSLWIILIFYGIQFQVDSPRNSRILRKLLERESVVKLMYLRCMSCIVFLQHRRKHSINSIEHKKKDVKVMCCQFVYGSLSESMDIVSGICSQWIKKKIEWRMKVLVWDLKVKVLQGNYNSDIFSFFLNSARFPNSHIYSTCHLKY